MNLVGYTDRLTAAPGDTVRFMVSSHHPRFRADLVQLIHGDESPAGPGYKERQVPSAIDGHYPGRPKPIHSGSYVHIPAHPALNALTSFTLTAWIYPTTPANGLQGLITRWTDAPAATASPSSSAPTATSPSTSPTARTHPFTPPPAPR